MQFKNSIAVSLMLACSIAPAFARWAGYATKDVPVGRLLSNLEASEKALPVYATDNERGQIEFELGRLHSLAYANKSEEAPASQRPITKDTTERASYGHVPDHKQPSVALTTDATKKKLAEEHLKQAIDHLEKAVRLNPSLAAAQMGLAWCLDQAGKKEKALKLYREVFKTAWAKEEHGSGLVGFSLTAECGTYLTALLDPQKDAVELKDVKDKMAKANQNYCAVTPVVIPLSTQASIDALIQKKNVNFNLDGNGARQCRAWLGPDAGWLVYDGADNGKIDSGRQLIGGVSFWIFWKNGYDVLSALDDNHDGKLTGSELTHLSIWRDANSDGIADRSEVQPLSKWHITELSCAYGQKRKNLLESGRGVKFDDGTTRPTYDVWIDEAPNR